MIQRDIKMVCELAYAGIKEQEEVLKKMRELCKHPETFEGDYSFRIGSIHRAIICSDCNKMIRFVDFPTTKTSTP